MSTLTEACEAGMCGNCYKGWDQEGGWCQCFCHPVPEDAQTWDDKVEVAAHRTDCPYFGSDDDTAPCDCPMQWIGREPEAAVHPIIAAVRRARGGPVPPRVRGFS